MISTVTASGVVTHAGYQGAYGNLIVLDHGFGLQTRYGHLSGFAVKKGERVKRGESTRISGDCVTLIGPAASAVAAGRGSTWLPSRRTRR